MLSHVSLFQNAYGDHNEGVGKLPSLLRWLSENSPSTFMKIDTWGLGGPYQRSILIFKDVIEALQKVEGAPQFYSTDFSHQYVQFGAYGCIWGLVTVDPDGKFCLMNY